MSDDSLPQGWEWVSDSDSRVPRGGLGAWHPEKLVLVFVAPPPWSCPWCGETDRWAGACLSADFLTGETREELYAKWAELQIAKARMECVGSYDQKVHDIVWGRWCTKIRQPPVGIVRR